MNREIIKKVFSQSYNVITAANGIEAMKIIETTPVAIVITDIFMEPMNGYELINNIRSKEEYKKIPIIAVTESDKASRKKALKAGADDLIYRPFISTILHNRVNGLLFDGFDINRYKLAYENNPIPFALYQVIDRPDTPSYKILYLNKSARENFSPPFTEYFLHTDENPQHRDFLLTALRTGDVQCCTAFDEQTKKMLDWTAYPDGNGLIAAMVHDITQQIEKQTKIEKFHKEEAIKARNELSDIISNIPSGIFVFRVDENEFCVIEANTAGCKLLDVDSKKVIGADKKAIMSFVHPDDAEVVENKIFKLAVSDCDVEYQCRIFNRSKNDYVWFAAQGHSKIQPDGNVYAFISYSDITSQKQLIETQTELLAVQKTNLAKTEFLSRMSHDMRTPMNGILGLIELMQEKDDIDDIKEDISQIKLSGHYLLNLLNDTLDISKIEAGKLELHEEPTNSIEVMQNILGNAQMLATGKGVQLKIILPPIPKEKWKPIIVDSARLEQILINIISNAVKYTPENGIVEIDMKTLSVTDTEVCDKYVIRDTGIGISEEFLPHIFDSFTQEGRMYTKRQNGTGLGLTIVKQLVDLMGGEISIKSEVDVGTEVTLIMRYKTFNGSLNVPQSTPTDILKGKRILLCDDHPLNAQIATKLLEKAGMQIDLASDGSIGVGMYEAAKDYYYDAVLMDIRMPVMNGLEAAREIRKSCKKDSKTIPIIAMTANAFDEDVENCLLAGMNAHMSKPISPEKMYHLLSKYISKNQIE